jgi:hypothetical protein
MRKRQGLGSRTPVYSFDEFSASLIDKPKTNFLIGLPSASVGLPDLCVSFTSPASYGEKEPGETQYPVRESQFLILMSIKPNETGE